MSKDQFTISNRELQAICDAHGLGKMESVEWAGRGRNNPVLILNDRYVLRFDGLQHEGRSRFFGEKLAYENLRARGIPAPEVLALDISKTLATRDYLMMSKVEGQPVIDAWENLSPEQRQTVAFEAGMYLAQMHDIELLGYGQIRQLEADRFASWYAYITEYMGRYGAEAIEMGILTDQENQQMQALFVRYKPLFDRVIPGRLVHWDYHFENILQQNGHVTGILDFEWSLSGDPIYDFKVRQQWEDTCPGSREWVYKGYISQHSLPDDHELKVALYRVMMLLDYAVDAMDEAEMREASDLLRVELQAARKL